MIFARSVGENYGWRARKKAESQDSELAHVKSEIAAWKALANR